MVTIKLTFTPNPKMENENAGLVVMGFSYAGLALMSKKDGIYLVHTWSKDAKKCKSETGKVVTNMAAPEVYFRVKVTNGATCRFSYSLDGKTFIDVCDAYTAETGQRIGAKVGLFCTRETQINDSGYADVDWFGVEPVE